jgi:hypothetical protein
MKMDHDEWIEQNVDTFKFDKDILVITCGHGVQEYFIQLRQSNPTVSYVCCPGCYHMISGDMIERIFTLKTR